MASPRALYQGACVDLNCRCNSALEKVLPDGADAALAIQSLDLSLNLVGSLGCRALLTALPMLCNLRSLNLSRNDIDNDCVSVLCGVVGHMLLFNLILCGNPISQVGGKAVLRLAQRSDTLEVIDLTGTLVNIALQRRISAVLADARGKRLAALSSSGRPEDADVASPNSHVAPEGDDVRAEVPLEIDAAADKGAELDGSGSQRSTCSTSAEQEKRANALRHVAKWTPPHRLRCLGLVICAGARQRTSSETALPDDGYTALATVAAAATRRAAKHRGRRGGAMPINVARYDEDEEEADYYAVMDDVGMLEDDESVDEVD